MNIYMFFLHKISNIYTNIENYKMNLIWIFIDILLLCWLDSCVVGGLVGSMVR